MSNSIFFFKFKKNYFFTFYLIKLWHETKLFFIVRFDIPQDYQHALMDGPWFVGDHYLHVQAWEEDFHPYVAKISTTAVWIHLE